MKQNRHLHPIHTFGKKLVLYVINSDNILGEEKWCGCRIN